MVPTLLRVTPATAITFVVYENVSHFLLEQSADYAKRLQIGAASTWLTAPLTPAVL